MSDAASAIFVALEQSGFASAIRQSIWLYPLANVGHIVSLVVFVGSVTMMDVRLAGGLHATAPGRLIGRARRFAVAGLCGLAVTGFMLFSAEASHLATNRVFWLKMSLVAVGLINVAAYELGAHRTVENLPPGAAMPLWVRFAGWASLAIWLVVAACGRSIAYF